MTRFGDAALPDMLTAPAACPRHGDYSLPCGMRYVEPLAKRGD